MLTSALQTWQAGAQAQASHTDKLRVAAVRWRLMSLASAFSAWVHWHQDHCQQQQTLDLVLRRWAHGHASHAFVTWQHWAREQRALRKVVRPSKGPPNNMPWSLRCSRQQRCLDVGPW